MSGDEGEVEHRPVRTVALGTIGKEWLRLGCIGFGGPPTHIALLRRLCVEERQWIEAKEFEDAIATTNLLPGPASTQLAIYCAWRLRGAVGALLGGLCFIVPGLVLILALSAVFLASHPPDWILGAAAGAGAAVPAVALNAAWGLVPASWKRIGAERAQQVRWVVYALVGGAAAATVGPYLVLVLVGLRRDRDRASAGRADRCSPGSARAFVPPSSSTGRRSVASGRWRWVAFKVGALSYGGGFVIIPLMQHDAVTTYHWMTGAQFLNAVALGQVTPARSSRPWPSSATRPGEWAVGCLAALIAFAPSFAFVLVGGPHFDRIRANGAVQSFLTGAGPAVIGAIAGSAIPLGLAFGHLWQIPVLAGALVWLFVARRGVVNALLIAGAIGAVVTLAGVPA